MSLHSWLQNLRTALALGRGRRQHGRRSSLRPATHRPSVEVLEHRLALSFSTPVNYPVAWAALDMDLGDFNSDGKADLVTISGTQVSVLPGHGDGTFAAAQSTSVGTGLDSVAVGDLNGDGRLDLAITSGRSVLVLLNNTDAPGGPVTFQAARRFSTSYDLGELVVGDLSGDGKLDVAAANFLANYGGDGVVVLQGDGAGNLGVARRFDGGFYPSSVAIGDIDGDGRLDLATADLRSATWASGNVSVHINGGNDPTGAVQFQAARNMDVFANPQSVAVGDFDNDGKLDLAVSSNVPACYYDGYYCGPEGYVNVLLGHGDGTFDAARTTWLYWTDVGDLATGDFNGDGKLDVAVTEGPYNAEVLLGFGDGTFKARERYGVGTGPAAVVVGNFNSDTFPDLAVANPRIWEGYGSYSDVSVLINNGDWSLLPPLLRINDATVTEGNTGAAEAVFTVTLSAASTETITVGYASSDGTATADNDYQATAGTLTFAPGETSKIVTVLVNGDRITEQTEYTDCGYWECNSYFADHEYFSVNLTSSDYATIFDGQGVGTVFDDEPRISISHGTVTEGNTGTREATFTVSLAQAYDVDVSVSYATADGSATAASDYQARSDTVTIAAGQTSQVISILVNGDRLAEDSEYFYVSLLSTDSGAIAYGQAVGWIGDDEPRISITPFMSLSEGNTSQTPFAFAVTLSSAYDAPVTVDWATADNSATAASDYQAASGTLIIPAGQITETITVLVNGDRLPEPNENFYLNLSSATHAAIIIGLSEGTILDDEPRISIGDVTKYEGRKGRTTLFVFTVTLSAAYDEAVMMSFGTVEGTATTSNNDYVAKTGTLTFKPGETTRTITIEVKGDGKREANETFNLDLFGLSGNALFSKSRGIGTIMNDD